MRETEVKETTPIELKLVRVIVGAVVSLFVASIPLIWYAAQMKSTLDTVAAQIVTVVGNDAKQNADIVRMEVRLSKLEEYGSKPLRDKLDEIMRDLNVIKNNGHNGSKTP